MQTLNFLGRGSAFNLKEGNTSAYIKQDGELLLIDCGENIFQRAIETKLLDDIKMVNVLITHLNSDHVGSLSSLIYYCYYIKKVKVNVYYPNEELFDLLKLMGNEKEYTQNKITFNDNYISSNIVDNVNCFYIKHIDTMICFSYVLFLKNDKNIYYSGDCSCLGCVNPLNNWVDEFYQDTCLADYEGNVHLSLKKLCELIPKDKRNKLYCMHLDCDELIDKAKQEGFNVVAVYK